jgi:hypothetical protein
MSGVRRHQNRNLRRDDFKEVCGGTIVHCTYLISCKVRGTQAGRQAESLQSTPNTMDHARKELFNTDAYLSVVLQIMNEVIYPSRERAQGVFDLFHKLLLGFVICATELKHVFQIADILPNQKLRHTRRDHQSKQGDQ